MSGYPLFRRAIGVRVHLFIAVRELCVALRQKRRGDVLLSPFISVDHSPETNTLSEVITQAIKTTEPPQSALTQALCIHDWSIHTPYVFRNVWHIRVFVQPALVASAKRDDLLVRSLASIEVPEDVHLVADCDQHGLDGELVMDQNDLAGILCALRA